MLSLKSKRSKEASKSNIERFAWYSRYVSIFVMGTFYFFVGWKHLVEPELFIQIFPPFLPFAEEAVFWTGIWEMALGLLLIIPQTRYIGAVATVTLLILVLPANIFMVMDHEVRAVIGFTKSEALVRVFFQIPLILMALWHGKSNRSRSFSILCSLLFPPTVIYFLTL